MIRINLLPVRQVRRAQETRRHLVIMLIAIAVQLGAMYILYDGIERQVELVQRNVQTVQTQIDQLKTEVGDFDKLRGERDRLLSQRKVINELHRNRTGPVWMMRELSDILTEGKNPTVNEQEYDSLVRRDPSAGYNPRWNPRRLWIETISQKGKRLDITGRAKDHDDVAELLKRLSLSRYFARVQLQRNAQVVDGRLKLRVVQFSLSCDVNFKG